MSRPRSASAPNWHSAARRAHPACCFAKRGRTHESQSPGARLRGFDLPVAAYPRSVVVAVVPQNVHADPRIRVRTDVLAVRPIDVVRAIGGVTGFGTAILIGNAGNALGLRGTSLRIGVAIRALSQRRR